MGFRLRIRSRQHKTEIPKTKEAWEMSSVVTGLTPRGQFPSCRRVGWGSGRAVPRRWEREDRAGASKVAPGHWRWGICAERGRRSLYGGPRESMAEGGLSLFRVRLSLTKEQWQQGWGWNSETSGQVVLVGMAFQLSPHENNLLIH